MSFVLHATKVLSTLRTTALNPRFPCLTKSYGHMLRPWRQWIETPVKPCIHIRSTDPDTSNVALWFHVKLRTVFGHELPWRHGDRRPAWDFQRQGASVTHSFPSVLEISLRDVYGLCSRNYRQERSISRIRSSDLFKMACETLPSEEPALERFAHVADVLFGLCGDISWCRWW
jgi:hypothetical protein